MTADRTENIQQVDFRFTGSRLQKEREKGVNEDTMIWYDKQNH